MFGPIDIWINCAMASVFAEFADVTPEESERVTRVPQAFLRGARVTAPTLPGSAPEATRSSSMRGTRSGGRPSTS